MFSFRPCYLQKSVQWYLFDSVFIGVIFLVFFITMVCHLTNMFFFISAGYYIPIYHQGELDFMTLFYICTGHLWIKIVVLLGAISPERS